MIEYSVFDDLTQTTLIIRIGQSAADNWKLIESSQSHDLWFHAGRQLSSPHVVISIPDKVGPISKSTIMYAASLCKLKSRYSHLRRLSIIYTPIINIKKGTQPGSVITRSQHQVRTVVV